MFRTRVSDGVKGIVTARLARELGYETVATMYINNAYGESYTGVFTEKFEDFGGSVSAEVGHESYLSELRKAADSGAEALIVIAYPESAGVFLREAVEGEFFDGYVFVDVAKSQELFDTIGDDSFDGSYGTAPGAPNTDSRRDFWSCTALVLTVTLILF